MNTRNEAIQEFLSEGIKAARVVGMPKEAEDAYCAGYLAGRLADQNTAHFQIADLDRIQKWVRNNPGLFHETMHNLDRYEIANLITQSAADLGSYVLRILQEEMLYQEPDDAEPDHAAEDDMRERVRDYRLEETGVC